jgi:phosphatidylglycerol:prolipoprotein diacylglycerol transferase
MMNSILAYYNGIPFDKPVVRFYALCILGGALLALFLSNYRAHKDGYDWSFFDTVFLVAFPCGILGARIWYVIATWPECSGLTTFFGQGSAWVWKPFAIWEGGLAIQGGALGGILAGLIYLRQRRKGTHALRALDFAVPTMLIAQAIGRWGNFFNQEVFGHSVSPEAWNFLPNWIVSNMQNGTDVMGETGVILPAGGIAVPMFLVEGVVNLLFCILIAYGLPAVEGKHYKEGDTTFSYFLVYGITRLVLEPLRNPAFIMGVTDSTSLAKSNYRSFVMAIIFIALGLVFLFFNHFLRHLAAKGKLDHVPVISRFLDKNNPASELTLKKDEEKTHDQEKQG